MSREAAREPDRPTPPLRLSSLALEAPLPAGRHSGFVAGPGPGSVRTVPRGVGSLTSDLGFRGLADRWGNSHPRVSLGFPAAGGSSAGPGLSPTLRRSQPPSLRTGLQPLPAPPWDPSGRPAGPHAFFAPPGLLSVIDAGSLLFLHCLLHCSSSCSLWSLAECVHGTSLVVSLAPKCPSVLLDTRGVPSGDSGSYVNTLFGQTSFQADPRAAGGRSHSRRVGCGCPEAPRQQAGRAPPPREGLRGPEAPGPHLAGGRGNPGSPGVSVCSVERSVRGVSGLLGRLSPRLWPQTGGSFVGRLLRGAVLAFLGLQRLHLRVRVL